MWCTTRKGPEMRSNILSEFRIIFHLCVKCEIKMQEFYFTAELMLHEKSLHFPVLTFFFKKKKKKPCLTDFQVEFWQDVSVPPFHCLHLRMNHFFSHRIKILSSAQICPFGQLCNVLLSPRFHMIMKVSFNKVTKSFFLMWVLAIHVESSPLIVCLFSFAVTSISLEWIILKWW